MTGWYLMCLSHNKAEQSCDEAGERAPELLFGENFGCGSVLIQDFGFWRSLQILPLPPAARFGIFSGHEPVSLRSGPQRDCVSCLAVLRSEASSLFCCRSLRGGWNSQVKCCYLCCFLHNLCFVLLIPAEGLILTEKKSLPVC